MNCSHAKDGFLYDSASALKPMTPCMVIPLTWSFPTLWCPVLMVMNLQKQCGHSMKIFRSSLWRHGSSISSTSSFPIRERLLPVPNSWTSFGMRRQILRQELWMCIWRNCAGSLKPATSLNWKPFTVFLLFPDQSRRQVSELTSYWFFTFSPSDKMRLFSLSILRKSHIPEHFLFQSQQSGQHCEW